MRAKLAKSLRKLAKKMAADAGVTTVVSYTEDTKKRKREFIRDKDGFIVIDEKQVPVTREVSTGQMSVDPNTVRGIYLMVKKAAIKQGRIITV